MKSLLIGAAVASILFAGSTLSCAAATDTNGMMSAPASAGYRFELVGTPKTSGGRSMVSIKLVRTSDKQPVVGAIIIQSRADMGPIGMAAMTAPIKPMPATGPGVYTFEVSNGTVWNKPDKWALTFAAKVQGVARTVHGTVVVRLSP